MATLKNLHFSGIFAYLPIENLYYWSYRHGSGTIRKFSSLAIRTGVVEFDLSLTVFEILTFEVFQSLKFSKIDAKMTFKWGFCREFLS